MCISDSIVGSWGGGLIFKTSLLQFTSVDFNSKLLITIICGFVLGDAGSVPGGVSIRSVGHVVCPGLVLGHHICHTRGGVHHLQDISVVQEGLVVTWPHDGDYIFIATRALIQHYNLFFTLYTKCHDREKQTYFLTLCFV